MGDYRGGDGTSDDQVKDDYRAGDGTSDDGPSRWDTFTFPSQRPPKKGKRPYTGGTGQS